MARRVFYSFHYKPDSWRTAKVRNIGTIEGNKPARDNDWERVKRGGDATIKSWIARQMHGRSCTVVLVGKNTANRKWINHEIIESWNERMGVVGIYIHGLKDSYGHISRKGRNPFDFITDENRGTKLSSIVRCYDPQGKNSNERYAWISQHIENAIEEAIRIRRNN